MKYIMQIQIVDPTTREAQWVSIKVSHLSTPYEYDTREEAEKMLLICYGSHFALEPEKMRVIEK